MANSSHVVTSRELLEISKGSEAKRIEKIVLDWVADDANASIPTLSVPLYGRVVKVVTNPGSTAPTANYDITFNDPDDSALDAMAGLLANRHTTTTEQVLPQVSGAPIVLAGTYGVAVANNAVNSATGKIIIYLSDEV